MKKIIKKILNQMGYDVYKRSETTEKMGVLQNEIGKVPIDLEDEFIDLLKDANRLAGTQLFNVDTFDETLYSTYKAVRYVVDNNIPGDLVECGVWWGRHTMVMSLTLQQMDMVERNLYLYDTFAGMTEPGDYDAKWSRGMTAEANIERWREFQRETHNERCFCPIEQVRENVFSTGYPERLYHFVQGDVMKTIPNDNHEQIALLRLDTDWYELTKNELEHFYDLIPIGGVLSIDDYGSWEGCRKAVDEFFEKRGNYPLLCRSNRKERICVKTR